MSGWLHITAIPMAGTERGIQETVTTFSTLFGEPFFPVRASVYAAMLGEKLHESKAQVFLVNTDCWAASAGTRSAVSPLK